MKKCKYWKNAQHPENRHYCTNSENLFSAMIYAYKEECPLECKYFEEESVPPPPFDVEELKRWIEGRSALWPSFIWVYILDFIAELQGKQEEPEPEEKTCISWYQNRYKEFRCNNEESPRCYSIGASSKCPWIQGCKACKIVAEEPEGPEDLICDHWKMYGHNDYRCFFGSMLGPPRESNKCPWSKSCTCRETNETN